jgi:hypothetical protein
VGKDMTERIFADFNSEFQSKGGEWLEEEAAASNIHRCATGKPKLTT